MKLSDWLTQLTRQASRLQTAVLPLLLGEQSPSSSSSPLSLVSRSLSLRLKFSTGVASSDRIFTRLEKLSFGKINSFYSNLCSRS